jgi:antitoxin (DNA-binding transcriptional repressor) of toxin-antitoxin stability system
MNVKTADLKNNLSRYLRLVRETGETVIVCDRDTPVATLAPIARNADTEWHRYREEALARARKIGLDLPLPTARPARPCMPSVTPSPAPDGRTHVKTTDLLRKGRNY